MVVAWPDETGRIWRAAFSLDPAQPLITTMGPDGEAVIRGARPFYQGETGKRRGGWYAFFDDPTTHPEGTRHVQGTFRLRAATARSVGERVEVAFDGLRMGSFDGGVSYTFHPGSRLIQQEAVLTTDEPDVAYYYDGGLDMAAPADRQPGNNMRSEVVFYDTSGGAAARHAQRAAGRAHAGSGALSHAGDENGRRKRGGVSRAAPVLFPARFHLESGFRVAPRLAWPRRARHQAVARRELAVLPVGERAARPAAAHERVLSALRVDARQRARARAALHQQRPLPLASTATRR